MKNFGVRGWMEVSLGDICEKNETVDPRKAPDEEFEYVDVSSVSNDTFTIEQTQRLLGADAPSRARRKIRSGDILFATVRPTLQRIAQVPESLDGQVCSTGYIVLRPKAPLDARFLMHALFRPDFMDAMKLLQSGASYPAVTDKQVRTQKIPLPPLEEQKRIAEILDGAFDGLAHAHAHAEANLQNARELFESAAAKAFDDLNAPRKTLGETCDIYQPKTISTKEMKADGKYPVFGANGIIGRYDQYNHEEAQLLVTCRGTCGAVNISEPYSWITGNAMVIRPKDPTIKRDFLEFFFRCSVDLDGVITGTAQPQITRKNLSPITVPIPSCETQTKVIKHLREISDLSDRFASEYENKLRDLGDLRQSLLKKAFTSELT